MNNIHILPTEDPSNVFITKTEGLGFDNQMLENIELDCQNQHIYLTSDEEIMEGDWVYNTEFKNIKKPFLTCNDITSIKKEDRKIILTTNQYLIEDGVQAIDYEFLEWFVENPSCVEVDFIKLHKEKGYEFLGYEIIIPNETLEDAAEKWVFESNGHKWSNNDDTAGDNYGSFNEGAKWQQERSYSEEEVFHILVKAMKGNKVNQLSLFDNGVSNPIYTNLNKWFEQFKK